MGTIRGYGQRFSPVTSLWNKSKCCLWRKI